MKTFATVAALAAGIVIVGCVHQQEAPGLSGPSQLATTVTLTAAPDTIVQNGFSTSTIVIAAVGPTGGPAAGVPLRIDTFVNGAAASDFGTLSARTVTTNSNGTATVVLTAPAALP